MTGQEVAVSGGSTVLVLTTNCSHCFPIVIELTVAKSMKSNMCGGEKTKLWSIHNPGGASSFRGLYSIRALRGRFSSTLYVFRCPVWLSSLPCTQTGSRPVCFASLAARLGDKIFHSFPVAPAWLLSFIIQTCSRLVCLVVSQ